MIAQLAPGATPVVGQLLDFTVILPADGPKTTLEIFSGRSPRLDRVRGMSVVVV